MPRITETDIFKALVVIVLFLLIAFDPQMATVYLFMIFGAWLWISSDSYISLPIERSGEGRIRKFLWALVSYAGFLLLTTFLFSFLVPTVLADKPFQAIIQYLATATPILRGSKILTLLGWGLVIPIVESAFFFGTLFEGLAEWGGKIIGHPIDIKTYNIKSILLIGVIASLFALFHITAKGLANIPLMITFVFAVISCVLVIKDQEVYSAIWLHIISNTVAVLSSIGTI